MICTNVSVILCSIYDRNGPLGHTIYCSPAYHVLNNTHDPYCVWTRSAKFCTLLILGKYPLSSPAQWLWPPDPSSQFPCCSFAAAQSVCRADRPSTVGSAVAAMQIIPAFGRKCNPLFRAVINVLTMTPSLHVSTQILAMQCWNIPFHPSVQALSSLWNPTFYAPSTVMYCRLQYCMFSTVQYRTGQYQ